MHRAFKSKFGHGHVLTIGRILPFTLHWQTNINNNTRTVTYAEPDRNIENLSRRSACAAGYPS